MMSTVSTDKIHSRQGRLFDAEEMRAIASKPVIPATGGAPDARHGRGGVRRWRVGYLDRPQTRHRRTYGLALASAIQSAAT